MVRFPFLPREDKFFDLFVESAQNLVQGAELLAKLMAEWEGVEEKVRQITDLEHEGDSITHQIMAQLHRTFVTPLDREDISMLAQCLDDVIDFIQAAADAMFIYRIGRPTPRARELARIIIETTTEVGKAIPNLRHHKQLGQIQARCVEVNRLENEGDRVKRVALAELFQDTTDIAQIIKWREIYEAWRGKSGLHRQLIDYYRERLQGLGYEEVLRGDETGYEPLMRSARRGAPLYRLLFASKHPLGHDFWHKVTRRDVHGQVRLF